MISKFKTPVLIIFSALLLTVINISFFSSPAIADSGLSVSGAIVVADVSPGDTIIHKMNVSIGSSSAPADILVQLGGIGQAFDGGYQLLDNSHDNYDYSASQFTTIDKNEFHLDPGTSQEVNVTISVPGNVTTGGKYALINIRTKPSNNNGVGVISAVNVPIFLSIKNVEHVHTGKITGLTSTEATSGIPLDILTTFYNTGNHHFKFKGELTISDSQGKMLDSLYVAIGSSLIPNMSRQLKATFIPEAELPQGTYNIKSKVMLEDGTLLDEATGNFEIKAPYVPPPAPASVTLKPSLAANLYTDDGRISIEFPQGAVTSQANVSLQNYLANQLPSPPSGYKPAVTCFRVDGINGLLTQQAKVTVKYSSADLEKAGGDASKLSLARWDEAAGEWSVLDTRVDKNNMTLTATTNRFSIWTVMVGPPISPVNWPLIGTIGGIAAAVLAGLILVITKRKR